MLAPFVVGVKLLITLVTLILVTSWKVDILHMLKRIGPVSADLATQVALELSSVFPFSDFVRVTVQVLLILHLQCSQILHKEKTNEKLFFLQRDAIEFEL